MSDPKAPEVPSKDPWHRVVSVAGYRVTLWAVREALSAHGLAIVTEADRKVLEACAALEKGAITTGRQVSFWPAMAAVCKAELEARKTREK